MEAFVHRLSLALRDAMMIKKIETVTNVAAATQSYESWYWGSTCSDQAISEMKAICIFWYATVSKLFLYLEDKPQRTDNVMI